MENRIKTMSAGEYNHGFAVEWMRKDLGIVLDEARGNGATLPAKPWREAADLGGAWEVAFQSGRGAPATMRLQVKRLGRYQQQEQQRGGQGNAPGAGKSNQPMRDHVPSP